MDKPYIMQAFADGRLRIWRLPLDAQGFIDWFDCAEHLVKPISFAAEPNAPVEVYHGEPKTIGCSSP